MVACGLTHGDGLDLLLQLLVSKEHIIEARHVLGLALEHLKTVGRVAHAGSMHGWQQDCMGNKSSLMSHHGLQPTLQNFIVQVQCSSGLKLRIGADLGDEPDDHGGMEGKY